MNLTMYLEEVEHYLRSTLEETKMKGYVLGLSGGIDSALVAQLLNKSMVGKNFLCLIMPCYSNPQDLIDAKELAELNQLPYQIIDLGPTFDELSKSLPELNSLTAGNLKARLRMATLYAIAQTNNFLVIGTDNYDEKYTGYFTKHGDGAADLFPISRLIKREVFEAARIYHVTPTILNKKPSAGLVDNQTDEDDLRVTYDVLDDFLMGYEIDSESQSRIEELHKNSAHKRTLGLEGPEFFRDEE